MRYRQLQGLEESTEEAKKIRKLLTTSVRGDGLRSEIRSLVVKQSTITHLLTSYLDLEERQKEERNKYLIQHCMAADNPLAQAVITGGMEGISESIASVSSEIAIIRFNATAGCERATSAYL